MSYKNQLISVLTRCVEVQDELASMTHAHRVLTEKFKALEERNTELTSLGTQARIEIEKSTYIIEQYQVAIANLRKRLQDLNEAANYRTREAIVGYEGNIILTDELDDII